MTLENIYKNESCSPTPGRKAWLLFQTETCPWALETHVFLSFLWSVVCKWHVIKVILITLKIPTKRQDQ